MPWECSEKVRFDDATEQYYLAEVCVDDCVTYQCVDEPDTVKFIRFLTDDEVIAITQNKP